VVSAEGALNVPIPMNEPGRPLSSSSQKALTKNSEGLYRIFRDRMSYCNRFFLLDFGVGLGAISCLPLVLPTHALGVPLHAIFTLRKCAHPALSSDNSTPFNTSRTFASNDSVDGHEEHCSLLSGNFRDAFDSQKPQAPIRNRQTRKVANARVHNRQVIGGKPIIIFF